MVSGQPHMADSGPAFDRGSGLGVPRWLYLAGAGRSGSTVLGMVLAQEARAFNCGELIQLWSRLDNGGLCQCGRPVSRCDLWAAVAAGVRREVGQRSFADLAAQIAGMRPSHLHVRLPRPSPADIELRAATERAVEEVTGAHALVDTSKSPYVLATATPRQRSLTVVHLVRDPRAVAYSNLQSKIDPAQGGSMHQKRRPVWKSTLQWGLVNYRTERVLIGGARRGSPHESQRVAYEDVTDAPDAVLAPLVDAIVAPPGAGSVPQGHAVAGNPVLFEDAPLRADQRWVSGMTRRQNMLVAAIAGPLMIRYGYRLDPWRPRRS